MAFDSMTVRLHLYRIRVIGVLTDLPERLEVVVRDLRSVVRCPFCGLKTSKVHDTRRVKIKGSLRRAARRPARGGARSSRTRSLAESRKWTNRAPGQGPVRACNDLS